MFNLFSWLSDKQKTTMYDAAITSDRIVRNTAMKIAEIAIIDAHKNSASFVKCLLCPPEDMFIRDPSDLDAQKQIAEHIAEHHRDAVGEALYDRIFGPKNENEN